jgi:hypothetical protein
MLDDCPESRCNLNEQEINSLNEWRILWKCAWNGEFSFDDVKGKEEDGWGPAKGKTKDLILTIEANMNAKPLGSDPIVRY